MTKFCAVEALIFKIILLDFEPVHVVYLYLWLTDAKNRDKLEPVSHFFDCSACQHK